MRIEWDEAKRKANLQKHGLDFVDVEGVFQNETATIPDERFDYGEDRFVTFGIFNGITVSVVHTEVDDLVRVISFRKATPSEERHYYAAIRD